MNEEIQVMLDKLAAVPEEFNVDQVFGAPQQHGDRTVIPVATVMYGVAFATGALEGRGPSESAGAEKAETAAPKVMEGIPEGSGTAGSSGVIARPMAYIEIDADGVRVKPIVNEQIVAVAGICLVGWALAWLGAVLMTIFGPRDS